jgi:hypothetical protein
MMSEDKAREIFEAVPELSQFFDYFGLDQTPENLEQLQVFINAMQIYNNRTVKYGDAWKQYGALSQLVRSANKVDRLMAVWWFGQSGVALGKEALDDAYDALNHLVFFIRASTEGNLVGKMPERPDDQQTLMADNRPVRATTGDSFRCGVCDTIWNDVDAELLAALQLEHGVNGDHRG